MDRLSILVGRLINLMAPTNIFFHKSAVFCISSVTLIGSWNPRYRETRPLFFGKMSILLNVTAVPRCTAEDFAIYASCKPVLLTVKVRFSRGSGVFGQHCTLF